MVPWFGSRLKVSSCVVRVFVPWPKNIFVSCWGSSTLSTTMVTPVLVSLVNPMMLVLRLVEIGRSSIATFWGPSLSRVIWTVTVLVFPTSSVTVTVTSKVPPSSGSVISSVKSPDPFAVVVC